MPDHQQLASQMFVKALELCRDDPFLVNEYATHLSRQQLYREAATHYELAVKLLTTGPENSQGTSYDGKYVAAMLGNYGYCLLKLKMYQPATDYLRQSVHTNPTAGNRSMLGYAL